MAFIPRIYLAEPIGIGTLISLPSETAHHVNNVLRLGVNDAIMLFNGDNHEYSAKIVQASRKQIQAQVIEKAAANRESPLSIHLGQGITRSEKMDWIIQKAVELGVSSITPLFTEKTQVKLQGERLSKKMHHWKRVIVSACEQCGRNQLPTLHSAQNFSQWLPQAHGSPRAILHPGNQANPLSTLPVQSCCTLLIGPESGFSHQEVALAQQHDFTPSSLGPRVLRAETAPLTALSILQCVFGDLK